MPIITAIISAYYAKDYLEDRINNLLGQDVLLDIIVVCQKDSIEHQIAVSKMVDVITTDDIPNVYKAWNIGLKYATGEYIINANTDDVLYDGALHEMACRLDEGYSVVFSDVDVKTDKGILRWKRIDTFTIEGLKKRSFIGPMPMWKKSLHDKYGLFDDTYHVAGDWEFFLRVAIAGEPFCYIPYPLGLYWRRNDSIEHRMKDICKMESNKIKALYK